MLNVSKQDKNSVEGDKKPETVVCVILFVRIAPLTR